jgi:hypothetical protein
MAATAQGFADHEMRPVADAMRDAAAAARRHAAKMKRAVRAIFSFFSTAASAVVRWARGRLQGRQKSLTNRGHRTVA